MITKRNFLKGLEPFIFPWEERKVRITEDYAFVYGNISMAYDDIVSYTKQHNYHFAYKKANGLTYLKFYPINEVRDCYQEFINGEHKDTHIVQFLPNINKGFVEIVKMGKEEVTSLNNLRKKYPKVYIGIEANEYEGLTRIVFYEKPKEEKCNTTTHQKVVVNKEDEGLTAEDLVGLMLKKTLEKITGN